MCECGETIGGTDAETKINGDIKDKTVIAWLNLNESQINVIKNTIIFSSFIEDNSDIMGHLISICNDDEERVYFKKIQNGEEHNFDQKYSDLYISLTNVLKKLDSYLKNTILKKHKYCITRFTGLYKCKGESFPEICPYAYAYTFWKESFFDINPFLNEVIKPKIIRAVPYELPFNYREDPFRNLIMTLFSQNNLTYLEARWCLSHIVWKLAYNHFEDWMEIAKSYAHLKTRPKTKFDDIFNDQTIFLFAEKENRIELYYTKKVREINDVRCPLDNNNNKKIRTQETSHLPMRLALTNGRLDDKLAAEQYLRELRILSTIK